jgi:hypothetical protein
VAAPRTKQIKRGVASAIADGWSAAEETARAICFVRRARQDVGADHEAADAASKTWNHVSSSGRKVMRT